MEFVTGLEDRKVKTLEELEREESVGTEVTVEGMVHSIRDMGEISFVILRSRDGLLQTVIQAGTGKEVLSEIREGQAVRVTGTVFKEERAPHGIEIHLADARILQNRKSRCQLPSTSGNFPHPWSKLKPPRHRIKKRPRASEIPHPGRYLPRLPRVYDKPGIHRDPYPEDRAKSAEGGANLFKLQYFHRPAVLAQSPQFYKQMMVGVFDRVFETAPVFRAEKHNTKRHLNEYTSLDFEMGYIDGFEDIMEMETGFLQYTMELLKTSYAKELEPLKIKLPDVPSIPRVRFDEAKQRVAEKYNRQFRNPFDLEPEEEVLIGQYFKEAYGSDFVFVTHYPSKKRPFYAMDDPADETYTLSFDLLFRGLEITTGGQRIHDYNKLMEKIAKRGMETEGMESYLSAFKYGMPPHGGLGIGLERLTMQLIGEDNVREATLFPRDLSRLEP